MLFVSLGCLDRQTERKEAQFWHTDFKTETLQAVNYRDILDNLIYVVFDAYIALGA